MPTHSHLSPIFPLLFLTINTRFFLSILLMEALHLPYEIHPHSLPAAVKDPRPEFQELPEPDIHIATSGGLRIPAHSTVLASVSSVLENIIEQPRKHRSSEKVIQIPGVPCEAVVSFVQFIYTSRCREEYLRKYGIHLLALSHVYLVPHLKQRCTKHLARNLTIHSVIDILQLARMCDAPDLSLSCMKMVSTHFKAVEKTEGWKFLQKHDPWLELQILQFMDESESRKKRCRRQRKEQRVYLQLSDAMECLEHICKEGCTNVGPLDVEPTKKQPCSKFSTCRGVQLLIKHFATCENRVHGGACWRCKRMWQLLRLHASICDQSDACKVPLCRQFKVKMQQENDGKEDPKWKLLVKKVLSAKTISSICLPKRKRAAADAMSADRIRSFRIQSVEQNRLLLLTA
ncbi:BTB/POZ and TAZ domain-containing protein 1-like [Benincasa hispida]|uniref:BTB/POZ and TAZ domain-containing protein 1-like n=1 Tax=Benincasa hispida TaxID=102211 RepID=UPI001900D561|nr:BTB/POZ and TAZ domain-containing protein 1-like [Benincasa hispida]